MGARESLNRRENMAQNKSKERREEPLGTMSYQSSSKRSPPFWLLISARKTQVFWHQSEARTAAAVWNWSGKTLSPGALLAVPYFSSFHIYLSARLDFPSPPLSAPGSPRMLYHQSYLQNATLIAKTTNSKIVLSYLASITEKWTNFRFRSRGLHVLAPHPQNAFFMTAGDLKTRQISRAQEAAPRFDFCLPCWCAAKTLTAKEFRLFPSVIWWVVHSFSCL